MRWSVWILATAMAFSPNDSLRAQEKSKTGSSAKEQSKPVEKVPEKVPAKASKKSDEHSFQHPKPSFKHDEKIKMLSEDCCKVGLCCQQ